MAILLESTELCSPTGSSLRQTRPHHSSIKEASLASGEAASDVYKYTANVPRFEWARTDTSSTCFTATDQRKHYDQPTTMTSKCHQRVVVTVIEHSLPRPRVYGIPFRATSLIYFKRLLKTHLFRIAYYTTIDCCNVEQLIGQKCISI